MWPAHSVAGVGSVAPASPFIADLEPLLLEHVHHEAIQSLGIDVDSFVIYVTILLSEVSI